MYVCRVFEIIVIWKNECVVNQTFSRWYCLKIKSILTVFVCNHNPIKFDKVPAGWNANHDRASSLLQRAADTPVTTDFQSGSCITWHTSAVQLFSQFQSVNNGFLTATLPTETISYKSTVNSRWMKWKASCCFSHVLCQVFASLVSTYIYTYIYVSFTTGLWAWGSCGVSLPLLWLCTLLDSDHGCHSTSFLKFLKVTLHTMPRYGRLLANSSVRITF